MVTRTVNDVAKITLSYTDPGSSLSVSGGNTMAFAAVVIATRGQPNKVLQINQSNWQDVLGKPLHIRAGSHAESLRHINEAVAGGTGYVVRVMPDDALYPVLTISDVVDSANTVTASTESYGNEVDLTPGSLSAIYLIDGDNELVRSIEMVPADKADYGDGFFELKLTEAQLDGSVKTLETQIVSFDINAIGIDNRPAFIDDMLSEKSKRLSAVTDISQSTQFVGIAKVAFAGGTSGTYVDIATEHYKAAIDTITAVQPVFEAVIAAGCYDDVALGALTALADFNNVEFFYDVEPNISFEAAVTRQVGLAMSSHFAVAYHMPYSAIDPFYKSRATWGLSGFVFAAKAKGVATKSPTGAWHLTPAGETRATITRKGLELNPKMGIADEVAFVNCRLNKLGKNSMGQLMIDDSLTCRTRKDALRFENQVSVDLAIGRAYVTLAKAIKHEPDGVTLDGLTDGMTAILDGYVASDCLVTPRDPEEGKTPYILHVEQLESDLWKVSWDICISGSARRIIGQPRLLK